MLTKQEIKQIVEEKQTIVVKFTPKMSSYLQVSPNQRPTNRDQVSLLCRLIEKRGMLTTPLIVATKVYNQRGDKNLNYYILDGNHRIQACLQLNKSFNFNVIYLDTIAEINELMSEINNSARPWTLDDHINNCAHTPAIQHHYIKLISFMNRYDNYSTSLLVNLLHFGNLNSRQSRMAIQGKFEYNYEAEAIDALSIFDIVNIHMAQGTEKRIKIALRSINFRAALLDFIKDNKSTLDVKQYIKGFSKNLISVNDLPSNNTEWRSAMNRYYMSSFKDTAATV
jgi:hypothetical protein